jgi:hypothetical protein
MLYIEMEERSPEEACLGLLLIFNAIYINIYPNTYVLRTPKGKSQIYSPANREGSNEVYGDMLAVPRHP